MKERKHLNIIAHDKITTCYDTIKQRNESCKNSSCNYWVEHQQGRNCAIVIAESGSAMTLAAVGELFNFSRMRICQLEKSAIQKLSSIIK